MNRRDLAEFIYMRDERCVVCYAPGNQLAHIIPQGKFGSLFIKRTLRENGFPDTWWRRVMHSPENMRLVCGLDCNSKVSRSNHPLEMREVVLAAATRIHRES